MNSNQIAHNFGLKAQNYTKLASIQKIIAHDLLSKIKEQMIANHHLNNNNSNKFNIALDLGCGPGINFNELHSLADQIIGVDLSNDMLNIANNLNIPNTSTFLGDLNNLLPLPKADLIFSSLALQWCNLPLALKHIESYLANHGIIAIAIPINGTLTELKSYLESVEINGSVNNFISLDNLANIAKNIWDSCEVFSHTYSIDYDNVKDYLASIRQIGANTTDNKEHSSKLNKNKYKVFMNILNNQLSTNNKLVHTYNIGFIIVNKYN